MPSEPPAFSGRFHPVGTRTASGAFAPPAQPLRWINTMEFGWSLPPDISEHGGQIDNLINTLHVFMFVLFVGWGAFFVYCLVRFRRREGHAAQYAPIKAKWSKWLEVAVVVFEVFLLVGLSMPVWANYKNKPPAEGERVDVRVIAKQFAWIVHYPGPDGKFGPTEYSKITEPAEFPGQLIGLDRTHPDSFDDIVRENQLVIPKDEDIYIEITSRDVIHSFGVSTLRVKQDAIPGMRVPIWFKAVMTSDELRAKLAKTFPVEEGMEPPLSRHWIATEDYKDGEGNVILGAGRKMTPANPKFDVVGTATQLKAAGISEVKLTIMDPVEIQCSQLCGLSHTNMRGTIDVVTPEAFDTWVKDQSERQSRSRKPRTGSNE